MAVTALAIAMLGGLLSARQTDTAADEVATLVGATLTAVGLAHEAADAAGRLGDSSSQIKDVVSAVSAIAGQTHLLALNATIEAARGRGRSRVRGGRR